MSMPSKIFVRDNIRNPDDATASVLVGELERQGDGLSGEARREIAPLHYAAFFGQRQADI